MLNIKQQLSNMIKFCKPVMLTSDRVFNLDDVIIYQVDSKSNFILNIDSKDAIFNIIDNAIIPDEYTFICTRKEHDSITLLNLFPFPYSPSRQCFHIPAYYDNKFFFIDFIL
jgi:hypothetical protein